jgi:hypothetical protein
MPRRPCADLVPGEDIDDIEREIGKLRREGSLKAVERRPVAIIRNYFTCFEISPSKTDPLGELVRTVLRLAVGLQVEDKLLRGDAEGADLVVDQDLGAGGRRADAVTPAWRGHSNQLQYRAEIGVFSAIDGQAIGLGDLQRLLFGALQGEKLFVQSGELALALVGRQTAAGVAVTSIELGDQRGAEVGSEQRRQQRQNMAEGRMLVKFNPDRLPAMALPMIRRR